MDCLIAFGTTIVGEIANYTTASIGRQLGYIRNYQWNIDKLEAQIQSLEEKKTNVESQLEEAQRRGRDPTSDVDSWLSEVRRELEAGNEFLQNKLKGNAMCGLFPNLWLRRKLSKEAQHMEGTIAKLTEKDFNFSNIAKIPSLRNSFKNKEFEDFDSRNQSLEEIMEALKDPAHRMIGIYGAGGIGKTTLVTEVAKMAQLKGLFRKVVIVTMSRTFEVVVKQKEIAEKLGLALPEGTESARAERLKSGLRKQEKVLIVVDDIWATKVPDLSADFGIDFKDEQSDCKIVLVSRDKFVLQNLIGVEKNIDLKFLTVPESMDLFTNFVGGSIDSGFESLATSLVKECGGLPIAIVTIARALKKRNIFSWKDTLRKLESSPKEGYGKAYTYIKESYDYIESDQEKMVLLLCSLHEEDASIRVEDLMSIHGAVCNVFYTFDSLEEARDSMQNFVERLKYRCLLLNGDSPNTVKMHDVIRYIIGSIASEDKSMHRFADFPTFERILKGRGSEESCAVSVLRCDHNQVLEELECPKLQLLLLKCQFIHDRQSTQIKYDYFKTTRELRALRLDSFILSSLPQSFCSLQNLQTLSLRNCKLEDIALIGELKNLLVLDLSHSMFEVFPEQVGKLNCLRHLNLKDCTSLKVISPNVISSLVQLEELYMDWVRIKWGREVTLSNGDQRINASLIELKNLNRLRDLHLCIHPASALPEDSFMGESLERYQIQAKEFMQRRKFNFFFLIRLHRNSKIKYSSLCWLCLVGFRDLKHLPSGIYGSLKHLERLEIRNCRKMEELIPINEQLGRISSQIMLPKLKYIELHSLRSLKSVFAIECESLLELKIVNCRKLEAFFTDSRCTRVDEQLQQIIFINDKISFPRLKKLSVKGCNMKYLLSCSAARRLPELKCLELGDCENIEDIILVMEKKTPISFPKLHSVQLSHLPNFKSFSSSNSCTIECPYLEKLGIRECRQLGTSDIGETASIVYSEPLANVSFPRLEKLSVQRCNMKFLLSCSTARKLSELKHLELEYCSDIEEIIVVMEKNTIISFPKLLSLKLYRLDNLKRISSFDSCILECPYLEKLDLWECPKLGTSDIGSSRFTLIKDEKNQVGEKASPSDAQPIANEKVMLPSTLKQLLLLSDTSFRNLQELNISKCHTLLYLFPSSIVESLAQLKQLRIENCEIMEVVVTTTKAVGEDEKGLMHNHHILFPKLEHLTLLSLPKLKMFCEGDSIECPSLLKLMIRGNFKSLRTFAANNLQEDIGRRDLQVVQQPLFNHTVAFPKLEELSLCNISASAIWFQQSSAILSLPKLKVIEFEHYGDDNPTCFIPFDMHIHQDIERIDLLESSVEKIIWQHRGDHDHATLRNLKLTRLPNLKTLGIPSSMSFTNLVLLEVSQCNKLVNLFSDSTAKTLLKLKEMVIYDCKQLSEVIVENNEDEEERNCAIVLSQLKTLTLVGLPSLKRFYGGNTTIQFPLLEDFIVSECPQMEIFSNGTTSTLKLNKVITDLKPRYVSSRPRKGEAETKIQESDLNVAIRKIQENDIISYSIAFKRLFSETVRVINFF